MQKGMLFHSLLDPESGAYFEQATFEVEGELHLEAFQSSLNQLVQRHAIFRTSFVSTAKDELVQVVFSQRPWKIHFEDLRHLGSEEQQGWINGYSQQEQKQGFQLEEDMLMRMGIFQREEEQFSVVWSFHHILMDGWCLPLVTQEVFERYDAIQQGKTLTFQEVTPYKEYISWLENQDKQMASAYWEEYLHGYEGQTVLPILPEETVVAQHSNQSQTTKMVYSLGKELSTQLKELAKKHQVTLNTVMQAAWGIMLQKYNGSQDVVFGSVVAGRPEEIPSVESMIGLFSNTIPVRVKNEKTTGFNEVMKMIQEQALQSHDYATYPLYEIQAKTDQKQDLISHIMIFENYPISESSINSISISNIKMLEETNYKLNIIVVPENEIEIQLQFDLNHYTTKSINEIKKHWIKLLKDIVTNSYEPVERYSLISEEELSQFLETINRNQIDYSSQTLQQLFEEKVVSIPEKTAVVFRNQKLSYTELNEKANQLARTLMLKGVERGDFVGLMVERSLETMIGILAILKTGAAYVPIDPEYPTERISYIIKMSYSKVLLTQLHLKEKVYFEGEYLFLDDLSNYYGNSSNISLDTSPNDLAYIIFTSGSTGNPKGVAIEHHSVSNFLEELDRRDPNSKNNRLLQKTSISFDASIWELFWWMKKEGSLYMLESGKEKDPSYLVRAVQDYKITHLEFVPSMLNAFLSYLEDNPEIQLPSLQYISVGGEALSTPLVERFHRNLGQSYEAVLYNTYGPTETTVEVISYMCSPNDDIRKNIPIGKPNLNTEVYILNGNQEMQPVGVPGELLIGGPGLSRGYLNNPEITQERFINNPFKNIYPNLSERIYKTGDLARWLPDGNLEYLGRTDDQVKIRGYRIELGEIELRILKVADVQEATVVVREKDGLKQLCAYYVAKKQLTVRQLREALASELPEYMIPSYFVQLKQMPLTANGKVDRKSLPAPEEQLVTGTAYVAPRTEVEQRLAQIWQDVLHLNQMNVLDNFFDIGGHSLRATTLASKIRKAFNIELTIREIFQYPTIEQLAEQLQTRHQAEFSIPVTRLQEYYPLSSAQKRMYVLSQTKGGELSYNMPGALYMEGNIDVSQLEQAFCTLIQRHESLRTSFEMFEGKPVQRIHEQVNFKVEQYQMSEVEVEQAINQFVRSFVLQEAPLLRVSVIHVGLERSILLFDMHHIISDGVSINIIIQEFIQLYKGEELVPLQRQYKDYACWQNEQLHSEAMKKHEAYWLRLLDGDLPQGELPIDYERPNARSYEGEILEFHVDENLTEKLQLVANESGTTLYMILLAAYSVLLAKYSGEEDVIIGTPIAGRTAAEVEPIVGMFVNTLALRTQPTGDKTFAGYLQEVKATLLQAYEHQEYPFEELIQKVQAKRQSNRSMLFDTMLVLQNTEEAMIEIPGLTLQPYKRNKIEAKFDLTLYVTPEQNQLTCNFEFATKLFRNTSVKKLSNDYIYILSELSNNIHNNLLNIELKEIVKEESLGLIEINI
ncbi:amino acid adenylation domain-containing protein [Paenibacillus sp. DRB1-1]|uniref:amino acid adenylation domain-containing protein n=1 Tax=Paenibacillus sp. DRB1-1 TaxID=3422309 RepID=UPI003F99FF21